jgi:hypothetical protein
MSALQKVIDILIQNKEWVLSGLGIFIFTTLLKLLSLIRFGKSKISVDWTTHVEMTQQGKDFQTGKSSISAVVLNHSDRTKYVKPPMIEFRTKGVGIQRFPVLHLLEPIQNQYELNPEQQKLFPINMEILYIQYLQDLPEDGKFRFLIYDTKDKKYFSVWIQKSFLSERLRMENKTIRRGW